jgi:hypothetical protein
VWGVGEGPETVLYIAGSSGTILRYAAATREVTEEPAGVEVDLLGIWVEDLDEAFVIAVGREGTVAIRRDGEWQVGQITRGDLHDVHGGPTGVFTAGEGGRIFSYDRDRDLLRAHWTGTDAALHGVWVGQTGAGEPTTWAVGEGGTILELR